MADYFVSDVHLRFDRPDRGRRLASLVDRLGPADRLVIAGDLCDFWFASRQRRADPTACAGLRALVAYRERGGTILPMLGNHDLGLGPFYERLLGTPIRPEPLLLEVAGLRLWVAHGHRLGSTSIWKTWMEGRAFLVGFGLAPGPLARGLESLLDRSNARHRPEADARHLEAYRREAAALAGSIDCLILGHVHVALDVPTPCPRLIVLGDWIEGGTYLRIDEAGAALHDVATGAVVASQ